MSIETKHTQTVYGDVDFKTRTCASCNQEYLPEDTRTYYHGEVRQVNDYSSFSTLRFNNHVNEVYFCEMCHNEPAGIALAGNQMSLIMFVMLLGVVLVCGLLLGGAFL